MIAMTDEACRRAAALLVAGRRGTPIEALPADLRPRSPDDTYAIQRRVAEVCGPIGGWKVGGAAGTTPLCAPMPAAWTTGDGVSRSGQTHRLRLVEAEVAFRLGDDLPPRASVYTRDEIVAAVATVHPAIEILESAFVAPLSGDARSASADLQIHGGFVAGIGISTWREIDFATVGVSLAVAGVVRAEGRGSNPAGSDLVGLVVWLANEGAVRTGGLRAGQFVTTGNWTGEQYAPAGAEVAVRFDRLGRVTTRF